ncbi:DEAD/DEAH box RNA helicase [Phytophthora cinnamomi]|uniref:DEAD/DEAH box RNA helicase n=1 Tax=Phytophthora cinnamomi TaxID=4785 RepID=UPI00355A44CD|nr:DEAD/DEAH box RNA helicase [Phytophthora cinnamomi]
MAAVERVLAELSRLNAEASTSPTAPASSPSANAALDQFSVLSASSSAPEAVLILPHNSSSPSTTAPFALPRARLTSPYAAQTTLQEELEAAAHPLFALERLGPFPRGWSASAVPPSRFLAQMPMSSPRQELVPQRAALVNSPLHLQYEFRPVDAARAGASAGFSSALSRQDEYARGKMSNRPFSPGGDSLAELQTETPPQDARTPTEKLLARQEEQHRNRLVLQQQSDELELELLQSLVFDVPGISGCLTAEDVRSIERQEVQQDGEEVENIVGVNPKSLLRPYFDAVADRDHVAAVRSAVLDEKAANAMRQNDENSTVGLDQLLREMEDDGELTELGFSVEDDEQEAVVEDGGDGKEDVNGAVATDIDAKVGTAATAASDADGGIDDPETELESILDSASESTALTLQKRTSPTSEWASMASVDVRNFHEKVPEMAMKYDFELDVFQKECVIHLERHECVFVAAHTSAEFHTQKALASKNIPKLIQKGKTLLQQLERSLVEDYPHLEASGELVQMQEFYQLKREKRELEKKLTKWLLTNNIQAAKSAIAPGRVVILNVKGLSSDQLALVVRTNSTKVDEGGTARSKLSFETELQSSSTADTSHKGVFKSIMVITLCPDDYEPPKVETTSATKKSPSTLFGGGRMLRSKKDDYDDRMFGRMGKKGKSESQESGELSAPSTATLLGRKYAVIEVPESCVESVTSVEASGVNTKTLVASSSKKELASSIEFLTQLEKDAATTQKAAIAYVDLMGDLKVNDLEVATGYSQWQQVHSMVLSHPCASDSPSVSRVMGKVEKIFKLKAYLVRMTRELSNDSLSLFPDFQQRLSVLKRLGYISEDGVVQVKGRVACEINTCEELVLTEMIFENVLANLEPEEIVAVLSALIFQEKSQSEPTLTQTLESTREVVKNIAESLGLIQLEQHLEIDPAVYCKGALNFGLMEVVYEWARGMPFKQLCELTDVQEGSIVRCITRLDEVCREVRNAARVIGDPQLYRKMEVASEAIKRDVVFASSLYLS